MTHTLKVPPLQLPVSLSEMRYQLGIVDADDISRDVNIKSAIQAATELVEEKINAAIVNQTWLYTNDCFLLAIDLKATLQSVVSVKYIDVDGVQQTLDPADYFIDDISSTLYPAYGETWPSARKQANSIQIEYISGFGDASQVPEVIKSSIKLITGHLENFQNSIESGVGLSTIPRTAFYLIKGHRDMRDIF